jgi:hypothetical protein
MPRSKNRENIQALLAKARQEAPKQADGSPLKKDVILHLKPLMVVDLDEAQLQKATRIVEAWCKDPPPDDDDGQMWFSDDFGSWRLSMDKGIISASGTVSDFRSAPLPFHVARLERSREHGKAVGRSIERQEHVVGILTKWTKAKVDAGITTDLGIERCLTDLNLIKPTPPQASEPDDDDDDDEEDLPEHPVI